MVNAARALHDISAHASLYVPISNLPQQLPKYVSLDRKSSWHTSALLMTAVESMTLPCRLRGNNQNRTTFHDVDAVLNVNNNQRIAQLRLRVPDLEHIEAIHTQRGQSLQGDPRVPTASNIHMLLGEDGLKKDSDSTQETELDLLPGIAQDVRPYSRTPNKATHTFGQVDCLRGSLENDAAPVSEEDDEYGRKRRRVANLPLIKRYQSGLRFEILDTFPDIFSEVPVGSSLAVQSSLSTTTSVADRVRALQRVVNRMVGFDEREALGNGLGEIAEAYEEGWDSGSDGDSDD